MYKYLLLIISLFLFMGCAAPNPPLFIMYPGDAIVKDQSGVATIITRFKVNVDGLKPSAETHYKISGNLEEELWAFDILPGEHLLKLSYTPSPTSTRSGGYVMTTTYASQTVEIKYNFEAGKIYWATIRGASSDKSDKIVLEEGKPADIKEYRSKSFDPDKFIKIVQKTRMLP